MGIVANAGPTSTYTFTGWNLRDSGSGNQTNFLTGLAVTVGDYQIGPNFLWQKPLVDPMPQDPPPPGRARNILEDPFAVRGNRETIGAELVLTYDPEPASWMWQWDNDVRETSKLAWSLGLALRHLPTTMDGALAINEEGNVFAFAAATPPRDLMWEANFRLVSKFATQGRLVGHVYGGTGDANGDDPRLIHRYGGDARVTWKSTALETFVKIRDWGPYDYHRDYNLTFPLQLMADLSHTLGTPRWFGYPQTRIGIRGTWRSLNEYSPRYCPAQELNAAGIPECITVGDYPKGDEWEIRTYIHISI
jgi:hypothetical protein